MNASQSQAIATGLLFFFTFGTGIWLSRSGKPFNAALLAVHKLVSLAAAALIGMAAYQHKSQATLSAAEIAGLVATALLFVLTVATGGLLSTGKPARAAISAAHRVAPFLTVLSTAVTLSLLAGGAR